MPEEELAENRSTIARALIETGKYDKDRIISFLIFLKSIIFIRSNEINNKFDSYIYQVTGGDINMGVIEIVKRQEREKGLQKGIEKERARAEAEKREVVRNLIIKFENLSDDSIATLAVVSVDLVEDVRKELNKNSADSTK